MFCFYFQVVQSCISCLGAVVNKVTHNIRLVKDYFQKYHGKTMSSPTYCMLPHEMFICIFIIFHGAVMDEWRQRLLFMQLLSDQQHHAQSYVTAIIYLKFSLYLVLFDF